MALWGEETPDLRVRIRESARARRLCVRVHHDAQVEVVVPRGTPRVRVVRFLAEHDNWIAQRVARLGKPAPVAFPPEEILLEALDERWRLHVAGGSGRLRLLEVAPGLLQLRGQGAPETGTAEAGAAARRLLRRWVVERARLALPPRVDAFAAQMGCSVAGVQVRTQRTPRGSCSARRIISLNAAVLFQPPRVLRYLLAHELAHLKHMNHSRAFWAAVAALEPHWRELDRQLLRGWERVPRWFRLRPTED
jgi:predicted metal-dependent hydrolase